MVENILNIRIQLRNDISNTWATKNPILLQGEMGIEYDTKKMKIGDGTTAWNDLDYSGIDEEAIQTIVNNNKSSFTEVEAQENESDHEALVREIATPKNGDMAVVIRTFAEDKHSYTAYIYTASAWTAMDGNYNAENVFLNSDITLAGDYTQVGNLIKTKTGTATFATKGKSIAEALTEIFSKRLQPTITVDPAVTLTFNQAKAYEVGTTVSPTYSAFLSAGSYTYGPDTGVTATSWEISDTAGNTADTASGSFADVIVTDDTNYKIMAKANYGEGTVAKDNLGADSNPVVKIAAGSVSKTSGAITGYRNSFYGTVTEKAEVTSTIIRSLTKSGKALRNGDSFTITIPVGAVRVIFAYPATLRDVTSVKDVNGLNAEIKGAFTKSALTVAGAGSDAGIEYKVYKTDFAEAVTKANSYRVTI